MRFLKALAACFCLIAFQASAQVAGSGLVTVRVVSNGDNVSLFLKDWTGLSVINPETQSTHDLKRITKGTSSTGLYSGWLPAGRYQLRRVDGNWYNGVSYVTTWASLRSMGSFVVEPDRVTNLGTVIYQPQDGKRHRFGLLVVDSEGRDAVAAQEKDAAALLAKPALGWETTAASLSAVAQFSKGTVLASNELATMGGNTYWGGKLGQVLVREQGGRWKNLDTGYTREILCVRPLSETSLLACGEEGLLLQSEDAGKSWNRIAVPERDAAVVFAGRGSDGQWYMVTHADPKVGIYRAPSLEKPEWVLLKTYQSNKTIIAPIDRPRTILTPERLVVAVPPGKFYVLELSPGSWQESDTAFIYTDVGVIDGLLYMKANNGLSYSVYTSTDWGKTWKNHRTSARAASPVFRDRKIAYLAYGTPFDFTRKELILLKTEDGGENWKETKVLPDFTVRLFLPAEANVLLAQNRLGEIHRSEDDGRSWKLERSYRKAGVEEGKAEEAGK